MCLVKVLFVSNKTTRIGCYTDGQWWQRSKPVPGQPVSSDEWVMSIGEGRGELRAQPPTPTPPPPAQQVIKAHTDYGLLGLVVVDQLGSLQGLLKVVHS